ncbi:MAG: DNA cytosine methyltransferase [Caulobacter sp.]|nr:DNA cytosine methyltransferase [Caulobacter sp.]
MALHTDHHPETADFRGLSLCAGYGGLDLGVHIAEPAYRTVGYVEREAHAAAALVARMGDQALAEAAVWDDLRTFEGRPWRGRLHLVTAGYPCQPFSVAGKRRGRDDPRHLWPEVARIVSEVEPEWVFLENVEGHVDLGLPEVVDELEIMGFTTKAGIFSAREAGARHRRRRIFILAHANRCRQRLLSGPDCPGGPHPVDLALRHRSGEWGPVPAGEGGAELDHPVDDPAGLRLDGDSGAPLFAPGPGELQAWERLLLRWPDLQPCLLRADHGLADWVDRTRAAGNGVCSLAAAVAWSTLKAAHRLGG